MYAKVLVDIKHEDVNRFFDYAIPSHMVSDVEKGMRVVVPFGHQKRLGYIIELIAESKQATKEIIELLDVIPTINEETFLLIDHLLKETNALYSTVFETVIPAEMGLDYYQEIRIIKRDIIDRNFLNKFDKNGVLQIAKGDHTNDYLIRKYVRLNSISVTPLWQQKANEKQLFVYRYQEKHAYHRITLYPEINHLEHKGYLKSELNDLGLTDSKISTLVKHGVLNKEKETIYRNIKHVYDLNPKDITLTSKQEQVYREFYNNLKDHQVFLLKGVTGSGKTELYLKWIKDVLDKQQQVLVLVPEIALIAPMAERLESTFGDIAIYHSHLSKGERFDQYMKIRRQEVSIVLGTRSAVFMPLNMLGLIIIDEEHESAYRQSERAAYDARDIARIRAAYHHCPLILGSATPSIVSMYRATEGRDQLLTLDERPFGIRAPNLELVDMREELKRKNTSMFSNKLKKAIEDRLLKKEQTMILFNRKGYAPFVMCRQCGYVPTCPSCGIALTYYQSDQTLRCHYCGHQEAYDQTCPACHHQTIKAVGVGIEQVEKEMKKTFPEARILRMDANMTQTKGAHEIIWHAFKHQEADILLGTQMIAKGLDFPKVTLVGVLMADLLLRSPSYRASEDAFTLLMQVAGRSGRMLPGDVIIQGYDLDHYAIKDVLLGYDKFYEEALYERKISGYEPFNHVYQICAEGKGYLKTYQGAFQLKKVLEQHALYHVLGPVPAYIKKRHDHFLFVLTIKTQTQTLEPLFQAISNIAHDDITFRFYRFADIL